MGDDKELTPSKYDMNAKWDACIDLTLRRFVYSSLAGAFGGLLFFIVSMLFCTRQRWLFPLYMRLLYIHSCRCQCKYDVYTCPKYVGI
uniref:MICOS complex subunit MIC10 n=1 Tax=Gossypium raimondii TaxID=29730 RepID=A0A0D2VF14_GOSRA|nr:hypothetical protein B456_013G138000 [Gossypium raimondii]